MQQDEIKVKVNGGYIVASKEEEPDYEGISICFVSDSGDIIDVVRVEAKAENLKKLIDVYCFKDVFDECFSEKFTLDTEEIKEAIGSDEDTTFTAFSLQE